MRTDATPSAKVCEIWRLILDGNTLREAAKAAGVSECTAERISAGRFGYPPPTGADPDEAPAGWTVDYPDYVAVNRAAAAVPREGYTLGQRIEAIAVLARVSARMVCLTLGFVNHPVARN